MMLLGLSVILLLAMQDVSLAGSRRNECLVSIEVRDDSPPVPEGDGACGRPDPQWRTGKRFVADACNGTCRFVVRLSRNLPTPGCRPRPLTKLSVLRDGVLRALPDLGGKQPVTGAENEIKVSVGTHRKRVTVLARAKQVADRDSVILECRPSTAPCCGDGRTDACEECDNGNDTNCDKCNTDCTEPRCGNGRKECGELCDGGDRCDVDCRTTFCGNGIVERPREDCERDSDCGVEACQECKCAPKVACDCGAATINRLRLLTIPAGPLASCGSLHGCDDSIRRDDLTCGTLWAGSGTSSFPDGVGLPAGVELIGTGTCNGAMFTITGLADDGGEAFFGPPVSVQAASPACIVTSVAAFNGGAVKDCRTGAIELALVLRSEVFSGACPICRDGKCRGGATPSANCTTSNADRTSTACQPAGNPEGSPIETAVVLETQSRTRAAPLCPYCVDPGPSETNVPAVGICSDGRTSCRNSDGCSGCGNAVECSSEKCIPPRNECRVLQVGAFGDPEACAIESTGLAAGDLRTGPKNAVLAGQFCIPPTFNSVVDQTAGLPGPGMLSLPVEVSLGVSDATTAP